MRKIFLFILLTGTTLVLMGQNLSYDFSKGNLSVSDWRSVVGSIQSKNFDIPDSDSLTSDGLVLLSDPEHPTYLKLLTKIIVLPGWKGDILETHEPFYVKYATSKIKVTLIGAGGDVVAHKTAEVRSTDPGKADLRGVECTDNGGCYLEVILWSHDTLETTKLNRLKKLEIRSNSPVTVFDFTRYGSDFWENNLGKIITSTPRKVDDPMSFRNLPDVTTSLSWVSGRLFAHGWRGRITANQVSPNPQVPTELSMYLKGHLTDTIFAQKIQNTSGHSQGSAAIEDAECNDPLGCYLEVKLSAGKNANQLIYHRLSSVSVAESTDQDDFDVGVFYMPFWHNDWGSPYWDSSETTHRWYIMDRYNEVMEERGLKNYVKKPLNIYGSESSPESYYNEEDMTVNLKQLSLMKDHNIDYVIYDSFYQYYKMSRADTVYDIKKWAPFWNEVVKNVSQLKDPVIPFAIMWANDFTSMVYEPTDPSSTKANPRGCRGFFEAYGGLDRLLNHWDTLLSNPNYKTIDGKPVLYIYYSATNDPALGGYTNSLEGLCGYCTDDPFFDELGSERYESNLHVRKTSFFLSTVEERLKKDIYFVAVISAGTAWQDLQQKMDWYVDYPTRGGFDAITSYGLSAYDGSDLFVNAKWWNWDWSYNYERMTSAYSKYYEFFLNDQYSTLTGANLKFHVPVSAGFNRGPLNMHEDKGSAEKGYAYAIWDQAISTPGTFESAIKAAKEQITQYPNQTGRKVTLCCWNEYAEGTVIEPTTTWGYDYLEKIRSVFSDEIEKEVPDETDLKTLEAPEIEKEETDESRTTGNKEIVYHPTFIENEFQLRIYPNPIERMARIQFKVVDKTPASVQILNSLGQVVQELINETVESGSHEIIWDATSKPKGFYFCRIVTNEFVEVKKLLLTH